MHLRGALGRRTVLDGGGPALPQWFYHDGDDATWTTAGNVMTERPRQPKCFGARFAEVGAAGSGNEGFMVASPEKEPIGSFNHMMPFQRHTDKANPGFVTNHSCSLSR